MKPMSMKNFFPQYVVSSKTIAIVPAGVSNSAACRIGMVLTAVKLLGCLPFTHRKGIRRVAMTTVDKPWQYRCVEINFVFMRNRTN